MINVIDKRAFRDCCGQFLTGVTVITTVDTEGNDVGITANSFTSVSLEPPLVLVCIDNKIHSFDAFRNAKSYAVHILTENQEKISGFFATKGADKFSSVETETGINNIPLLKDYLVRMECNVVNQVEAGDHIILIGEVQSLQRSNEDRKPLGFYSGKYVKL
ncbi:flavin reductase family protein [Bacillus sp. FJAT-29953]|nr:flavin reductase family protein [Bacillus sp. FJAT-29953]